VCYQGRNNFGPLLYAIPFGKSDHAAIFLLPEYKQRTVREAVVTREVRRWSDQVDDDIRDAMSDADWDIQADSAPVMSASLWTWL